MIVREANPATVPRMIQQSDALSVAPFPLPCSIYVYDKKKHHRERNQTTLFAGDLGSASPAHREEGKCKCTVITFK